MSSFQAVIGDSPRAPSMSRTMTSSEYAMLCTSILLPRGSAIAATPGDLLNSTLETPC